MTRATVFLHAGVMNARMWSQQLESFDDRTVLAPDLPGYGERRAERWGNLNSVTDRLADWIRERTDGPIELVGLSLGGITSIHLATRHPDLVAGIFVTGTSVLPYPLPMRLANRVALTIWNSPLTWKMMARSMNLDDAAIAEFLADAPASSKQTCVDQSREITPGRATQLNQVTAPVLAVVGQREASYFFDSLRVLRDELADVKVGVAPGMHHAWNSEDPDLFNRVLRPWLDRREVSKELLPLD